MSNDTMPCGCEGHADNESLCRYPALLARAEQAERERDEARETVDAWKDASGLLVGEDPDGVTPAMLARDLRQRDAEMTTEKAARARAEQERDEACQYMTAYKDAKERAEAANAALLDALNECGGARFAEDAYRACLRARAVSKEPHPGAALLAEVEALREVHVSVGPIASGVRAWADMDDSDPRTFLLRVGGPSESEGIATVEQVRDILDACAAVDALKRPA